MRAPPVRDIGRRAGHSRWHWLLVPLALLPLATFWYNGARPRLLGIPFFYWGQLGLIFVVWFGTFAVYLLTKKGR
jgi:Protein of unknown function (DUF3311)